MEIRIRPFIPTDREFIEGLVGRFSEFDLPPWRGREEIDNASRSSLQKAMEQPEPDAAIFVAEDETGKPMGFIHLQSQSDYFNGEKHGYISDLAVDPACEGRGVGSCLLEKAEEWGYEKGFRLLTLYVFAGNTEARRLYEKYGYGQEVIKYAKTI